MLCAAASSTSRCATSRCSTGRWRGSDGDVARRVPPPVRVVPLPVVAAVHGTCVGGGLELALACDLIFASRTAKIGSVEVTLGLNLLMGAVQRQVQRAGSLRQGDVDARSPLRRRDARALEPDQPRRRRRTPRRRYPNRGARKPTARPSPIGSQGPARMRGGQGGCSRRCGDGGVARCASGSPRTSASMDSFRSNGPGLARFVGR